MRRLNLGGFRWICILSVVAAAAVRPQGGFAKDQISLNPGWQLQTSEKVAAGGEILSTSAFVPTGWYPTEIPTTVLAALVENKVFPDPYYGLNLKSIPGYREAPWLVMPAGSPFRVSWWYRKNFEIPADWKGKHLFLEFDGINYKANIWLNGRRIADQDSVAGMFRRFEFEVTGACQPGSQNSLAVEIIPPGQLPDEAYRTKQLEATTGWDDHNPYPPDMNMGLWQGVSLAACGPVRVRNPYVSARLEIPSLKMAQLTVSAEVSNLTDQPIEAVLAGKIEQNVVSQSVSLAPGEKRTVAFQPADYPQLTLSNPRVWWPHPLGTQELYTVDVTADVGGTRSDSIETRFGIRDATTTINEEGWRTYWINGKRILIRGGAWMTSDMMLRLSQRRYEALVRYAREANLNMLRSEGFSIRETDTFFDLCDQYGILVTQQLFGRSIPDENLALACVEDTMIRIRNHPSLVHFLGHDETFPTPSLDQAYRALLAKYTPERTYQPHSGAFDVEERFETGGTRTGTRELWTYADPGKYYRGHEDGAWGFAQSGGIGGVVAPYESMRRMMPKEDLWPPFSETWSFHTVTQGGEYFDAMLKMLGARYGKPSGIEDFCRKAQAMNYESARAMFEAYGRNKYSASGITTWKYDAAWPASPTWQYIDWYLIAGGAYYGAKNGCKPLHVQYSYDDHSIWVVNGHRRAFKGLQVTASVYDLAMAQRLIKNASVTISEDASSHAFTLALPADLTKSFFLALRLSEESGALLDENIYWLSTVPDVPGDQGREDWKRFVLSPKSVADYTDLQRLPQVPVTLAQEIATQGKECLGHAVVKNLGTSPAFQTHLSVLKGEVGEEVSPAYWEDNYFTLLPGEERTIAVTFPAEDLEGKEPVIQVDGWNISRAD
jgi:exo-1,4-beta-D-glucosaminidase